MGEESRIMGNDPIRSKADETEGKYSSDKPLTFRELLDEQTDADRNPFKFQRSNEPDNPEIAEANKKRAREDSARSASSSHSEEDVRASSHFQKLGDQVLKSDLYGGEPIAEIGINSTSHSSPRWYALRQTLVDGKEYYYIRCEQYNSTFSGRITLLDFGTELIFSPMTLSSGIIDEAIEQQRQRDFQAGREPVTRIHPEQLNALNAAYRRLVDSRTSEAQEGAESQYKKKAPMEVFDQFVVDNESAQRVQEEVLEPTLLSRQQEVITETFLRSIARKSSVPSWVWQEEVTTDLPIMAKAEFKISR